MNAGISGVTQKQKVKCIECDTQRFMESCVDTYCKLVEIKRDTLPIAMTPFIEGDGNDYGLGAEDDHDIPLIKNNSAHMAAIRKCLIPEPDAEPEPMMAMGVSLGGDMLMA